MNNEPRPAGWPPPAPENWRNLDDKTLCQSTWDPLFDELDRCREGLVDREGRWKASRKRLRDFTDGQRFAVSLVSWIGLIDNGGFRLLYEEANAEMISDLRAAFQGIGATRYLELLKRVQTLFPRPYKGVSPVQLVIAWHTVVELAVEGNKSELEEIDHAFFDLHRTSDNWQATLARYIREHPSEFFRDA